MDAVELQLRLPRHLYQRLAQTAELAQCEVKEVIVSVLETTLPLLPEDLPPAVAAELARWMLLDDEALRAVKAAAPFGPIPSWVGKNRIDIIASFEYLDNRLNYRVVP